MRYDHAIQKRYIDWWQAESEALDVLAAVKDDTAHPDYQAADQRADMLRQELLALAPSLHGVLIKLMIACQYEDYLLTAQKPNCTFVAPRAIVTALWDLEMLVMTDDESGTL